MIKFPKELANLAFRIFGMLSKMSLIFILAKIAPGEIVVWYGTFTVVINYLLYVVGMDIYNFANREYIVSGDSTGIIRKQFSFYYCQYFVFFILFLFVSGVYSQLNFIILFILISEHLCSELFRIFIFKGKQVKASFIYFVKSFSILIFILSYYFYFQSINISFIELSWFMSNLLTIFLYFIYSNSLLKSIIKLEFCKEWFVRALKFSFPFLLSALCSKAIFTFDRVLVKSFLDVEVASMYILVVSILVGFNSVMDAVFFSFKSPKIVKSFSDGKIKEFYQGFLKDGFKLILIICPLIIAFIYACTYFYPDKMGGISVYGYVLTTIIFVLINASQIYHFVLFAYGSGKLIFKSQLYALLLVGLVLVSLRSYISFEFVLFLLFIYSLFCLLFKYRYAKRLLNEI
ncbi:hypothetical protein AB0530_000850 [Vibrio parahaemolyticus]